MNKKAFTLIELLGVIVLLVLITMITIPIISKAIKNGKETADEQIKENIVLAARNWAVDNKDKLPQTKNEKIIVNISTLQESGNIDKNIKMPSTEEEITNACVEITNTTNDNAIKKQYEYVYSENCS
ncbi:MAG: hypothetical protein HFH47_02850 [Bacilli bacterium]|nr:hypothetical protein [Bacilli bacterium]